MVTNGRRAVDDSIWTCTQPEGPGKEEEWGLNGGMNGGMNGERKEHIAGLQVSAFHWRVGDSA